MIYLCKKKLEENYARLFAHVAFYYFKKKKKMLPWSILNFGRLSIYFGKCYVFANNTIINKKQPLSKGNIAQFRYPYSYRTKYSALNCDKFWIQ